MKAILKRFYELNWMYFLFTIMKRESKKSSNQLAEIKRIIINLKLVDGQLFYEYLFKKNIQLDFEILQNYFFKEFYPYSSKFTSQHKG